MSSYPWAWGNWDDDGPLGEGGQGETRKLRSKSDNTKQAVLKTLKHNENDVARSRMNVEVANLKWLADAGARVPHVLEDNLRDYLDMSVGLYFVMTFFPGPTLEKFVTEKNGIDFETARQVTLGVCDTIKIAHQRPIVHRDLKPSNIILHNRSPTDVIVIDYGLSFNGEASLTKPDDRFRTSFCDLPEFTASGGSNRDPRSDVTLAAAIFLYCLTAQKPGSLQDEHGILPHKRAVSRFSEVADKQPWRDEVDRLLSRALHPQLPYRFQSCDELVDALKSVTAQGDEPDIFAMDAAFGRQLSQEHRPTQIRQMQPVAAEVLKTVEAHFNEANRSLKTFRSAVTSFGMRKQTKLPQSYDFVAEPNWSIGCSVPSEKPQIVYEFAVGARGFQQVLLYAEIVVAEDNLRPLMEAGRVWKEVLAFDKYDMSVYDAVGRFVTSLIADSMKKLMKLIHPAG